MDMLVEIETWLKNRLGEDADIRRDAPGGVHADLIRPQGKPRVSVVFSLSDNGQTEAGLCGDPVAIAPEYDIRAVAQTSSMASLGAVSSRIFELLKDSTEAVDGGQVFSSYVAPYRNDSLIAGNEYYQLGGTYRIDFRRTL